MSTIVRLQRTQTLDINDGMLSDIVAGSPVGEGLIVSGPWKIVRKDRDVAGGTRKKRKPRQSAQDGAQAGGQGTLPVDGGEDGGQAG